MSFLFEAALNWISDLRKSPIKCVEIGNKGDYVVLIHALVKCSWGMYKLEKSLASEGYEVINPSYLTRKYNIEDLAQKFLEKTLRKFCTDPKKKIHFVTHSLGAIIVRKYLETNSRLNIGRIVMIAPPNRGSEFADFLKSNFFTKKLYKIIFGPVGLQLGARKNSYVNTRLEKTIKYETGVIAGNYCLNPFAPFFIKGANDGLVSVSSTKIKGMKDHITLPCGHKFIISSEECLNQVSYFLNYGHFYHR